MQRIAYIRELASSGIFGLHIKLDKKAGIR